MKFYWTARLFRNGQVLDTKYFETQLERDQFVFANKEWKKRGKICAPNLDRHLEENVKKEIRIHQDDQDANIIRQKVFIEEQGVPHEEVFDGLQAMHVVIYENDQPVASSRIYHDDTWHIGLVAVLKEKRKQHYGELLMNSSVDYITSQGGKEIVLFAQQNVVPFYEKFGFTPYGEKIVFESGFVLIPMVFRK